MSTEPQSLATSGQRSLLAMVTVGWLVFIVVLLVRSTTPDLGVASGPGEHLFVSAVFSFVLTGLAATVGRWSVPTLAWYATVASSIIVLALELIQIVVPVRAFEVKDLAFGIAGTVLGTAGAALLILVVGRLMVVRLMLVLGSFGLVVGVAAAVVRDPSVIEARAAAEVEDCTTETDPAVDGEQWIGSSVGFLARTDDCITTTAWPLAAFGGSVELSPAEDGAGRASLLSFEGGGVVSGPLPGLPAALNGQPELSLGIRFRVRDRSVGEGASSLMRLLIDGQPNRPLAQISIRGPHIGVDVLSGEPSVGLELNLADAITDSRFHELIVVYETGEAVAYLDGQAVAGATGTPFRIKPRGELNVSMGQRIDQRWKPLDGEIEAILISPQALDADQVPDVFTES